MSNFLYPVQNAHRSVLSLDGLWQFRVDSKNEGRAAGWQNGLTGTVDMAVPSSYNDIFTEKELRDHCGDVWYETAIFIPEEWRDKDVFVRFGSATHRAVVWLNGQEVAAHDGGYMPFSGLLNEVASFGEENKLVVVVNNELSQITIPCGDVKVHADGTREVSPWFDFFNYSGLHRSVKLVALPNNRIEDVTVMTDVDGETGVVRYQVETTRVQDIQAKVLDADGEEVAACSGSEGELRLGNANLWQPGDGYLYELVIEGSSNGGLEDVYKLPVGIRTVEIKGSQFLINGEPFYFKGFGKHEDSDMRGRGYDPVVNLRDFELLKWIGANSVRTAHYPYSEEFMQMADRAGLVVIDETPAVGQFDLMKSGGGALAAGTGRGTRERVKFFDDEAVQTQGKAAHKDAIRELIKRDKNHPCVVMWSLSNEPDTSVSAADTYFADVFAFAREQDPQNRPMTFVNFMLAPYGRCKAHQYADVICLNRYYGWYMMGGLEQRNAGAAFAKELAGWATEDKPIVITEYGADTMPGVHKLPSVQWSEEYQIEYLDQQHFAFDGCPAVVGEQMWNFADFQTWEGIMRVNGNKKGAFTRDRQPKMAAHHLKARWAKISDFGYK